MAMANIGGGAIVIGMDKDGPDRWSPKGVSEEVDLSYQQDQVLQYVNERAQPPVHLSAFHVSHRGRRFVVIQVAGFTDLPVVCSKPVNKDLCQGAMYVRRQEEVPSEATQDGGELRDGALYSRSMGKYETAEVRGQSEMREILNRAIDAGIRRQLAPFEPFLEAMWAWMGSISPALSDEQRFEEQRDRP
jgi:hypothetical protein